MIDAGAIRRRAMEYFIAIVWGSRKSSRLRASATMMAALPSGVKYML